MTVLPGQAVDEDSDAAAPADPLELAATWLPSTEDGPGPTMTLSTLGIDGYPSARTVLLSRFDGERLHFHTDSRSRKAAELAALPRAAVTLVWPGRHGSSWSSGTWHPSPTPRPAPPTLPGPGTCRCSRG